jgi:hypothetical protein
LGSHRHKFGVPTPRLLVKIRPRYQTYQGISADAVIPLFLSGQFAGHSRKSFFAILCNTPQISNSTLHGINKLCYTEISLGIQKIIVHCPQGRRTVNEMADLIS